MNNHGSSSDTGRKKEYHTPLLFITFSICQHRIHILSHRLVWIQVNSDLKKVVRIQPLTGWRFSGFLAEKKIMKNEVNKYGIAGNPRKASSREPLFPRQHRFIYPRISSNNTIQSIETRRARRQSAKSKHNPKSTTSAAHALDRAPPVKTKSNGPDNIRTKRVRLTTSWFLASVSEMGETVLIRLL